MTIQSECNNIVNVKTGLRKTIQSNNGKLTVEDIFEAYPPAIADMHAGPKIIDTTGVPDYIADAITIFTVPNTITKLRDYAFSNDTTFLGINLQADTVVELGENVFKGTRIDSGEGKIYVPASLVNSYKTAEGWNKYASQIESVTNIPTIKVVHIIETIDRHRTISYMNSTKIENFSFQELKILIKTKKDFSKEIKDESPINRDFNGNKKDT